MGEGVPENGAEAVKWYRKAAEQGNAPSQLQLGHMYLEGWGVPKNGAEAEKWFRKAAEQGDAHGLWRLGFMYDNGNDIPQNFVKAYMWYSLAKAQGLENAATDLDIVQKRMTPADISKAQELAAEWWEEHNN